MPQLAEKIQYDMGKVMNRIKRMTVQELLDEGFEVRIYKHHFRNKISAKLEAKQYVSDKLIKEESYDGVEWAEAGTGDGKLRATFFLSTDR